MATAQSHSVSALPCHVNLSVSVDVRLSTSVGTLYVTTNMSFPVYSLLRIFFQPSLAVITNGVGRCHWLVCFSGNVGLPLY